MKGTIEAKLEAVTWRATWIKRTLKRTFEAKVEAATWHATTKRVIAPLAVASLALALGLAAVSSQPSVADGIESALSGDSASNAGNPAPGAGESTPTTDATSADAGSEPRPGRHDRRRFRSSSRG